MSDKQLQIPGLESSPGLLCLKSPRRLPDRSAGRISFLEKRIAALELELSLLKIQMEVDYA